ncbi:hypothetical protein [Methylomonas methanica]|uniref:MAE-28990/MAE-18760-like HEPN domain-containing protein n=1 Tax=Methylomonas methanica TaxID=421 RepID=A0A177MXR1_METMH|nr:hypothetical protein [Methylomonas methanica]OAI10174.1 hypothetical protein A1332_23965 [Methylomonas methanica]
MSQLKEQFLKEKIYAFLEQSMISDVKDFLVTSECNVEIQHAKELDRIQQLDVENNLPRGYILGLEEIARLRFEINMPIIIRYSAVVLLVTMIEWSIKNLNKQLRIPILIRDNNFVVNFFKKLSSEINFQQNEVLKDIEAIVYVRNCITHSAGILNEYKYSEQLPGFIARLNGFTFNNTAFVDGYLWIERNALNQYIDVIGDFIFLIFKDCYEKGLMKHLPDTLD